MRDVRQAELLNIAQTERLYFAALYRRQIRDLSTDTETLSNRLVEIVKRRFNSGLATTTQIANAQVAVRQARLQTQLAESAYQAALLALRQQLGTKSEAPFALSGELTKYEWLPIDQAVEFTANPAAGPVCYEGSSWNCRLISRSWGRAFLGWRTPGPRRAAVCTWWSSSAVRGRQEPRCATSA